MAKKDTDKQPKLNREEKKAAKALMKAKTGDTGEKAHKPAKEPGEKVRKRPRLLYATLTLLILGFTATVYAAYLRPSPGREVSFDKLFEMASANRIQSARLLDQDAVIVGIECAAPPPPAGRAVGVRPKPCFDAFKKRFHAAYPASQVTTQQLLETLRKDTGATITVDEQTPVEVAKVVANFVFPLLILANLFALIFLARSGGDSAMGEIAGFGKISKKRQHQGEGAANRVTFADVAGADEAIVELREVIDYLSDPVRFQAYGAAPPKGVLLFGPPGCGKTLLARATAGETDAAFFQASGTEFVESLVGVGAARVRDLFRQIREAAPAILFIDEIDAIGRRRSGEGSSGGEREQTLNQLLVELDGFEVSAGIVLMGATNRPDILDPALLRPGRFDRHITMTVPDLAGRIEILQLHGQGRPFDENVDLPGLAQRCPGFTGADLANVINEAALLAIREGPGVQITNDHLSEAVLRVLHGPQRRGQILSGEERKRLAYHESGHTLVAAALGHGLDVHRISIVSRGKTLGQTSQTSDDRVLLTAAELSGRLAIAMAGMAAEAMVFGDLSTTAEDDITRASALAREMIGLYGMSSKLGKVHLLNRNENGYLGSEGPTLGLVSGPTMADFDDEVRRLTEAAHEQATSIMEANRRELDDLAALLEEKETLEAAQLQPFLAGVSPSLGGGTDQGAPRTPRRRTAPARAPK